MTIARLCGGLGNQLFQYATARGLANLHGDRVKVDLSSYSASQPGVTERVFELGKMGVSFLELNQADGVRTRLALRIANSRIRPRTSARLQRAFTGLSVFTEPHFEYTEELLLQPPNVVLVGYWQSERYFRGVRNALVREMVPRQTLAGRTMRMAERIGRSRNAVGLHVRRGDYVTSPTTAAFHGLCTREYFESAVKQILAERPDADFFVFSDDPDWCREDLNLPVQVEIVSGDWSDDAVTDLHLMACCRHHVISNSSFGWWGAWLSGGADQIVFCPARWFKDDSINTRDLLPVAWRRL